MHFASLHNQKKDNNKLKNKYQPEVPDTEAYGSLTTKELKKKHSSRPVGGVETGSQGREDTWQDSGWRTWAGEMMAGRVGSPTFVCT